MTPNSNKKDGWRTTEFWSGLTGVVFIYLNKHLEWNLPEESVLTIIGLIVTYIASRTILKLKDKV